LSEVVLSLNKISKRFGRIKAVDELSLEVEKGNVFGILGPNGSGKTTTLGIILDVINPDSGYFQWFGKTPTKYERKKVGSIIESPIFYPYLSAVRNLKIIADIKGIPYNDIDRVLNIVDLIERKNSKFKTYSLGMKQRLAIAAALLGNPQALIFDEPTNGLDPQGIVEIRELILTVASEGITILLASHLLDEVQKTCTHVAILEKGRKLSSGKVKEVLNETGTVEISSENLEELYVIINNCDIVKSVVRQGDKLSVKLDKKVSSADLNNFLFNKGIVLSHLTIIKKTLEKYFLELLNESDDKPA
jgi:ABC-2 type transport system ATP-binding protein